MKLYQNRIVVKVGTSTLTNENGKSDLRATDRLVCVLSDIQNMGYEIILVSSGAIAVGSNKMNLSKRPTSMRMILLVTAKLNRKTAYLATMICYPPLSQYCAGQNA